MYHYKHVFRYAQTKGYKPTFEWNKETNNILFEEDIRVLIEVTLIQKWLRDNHSIIAMALPYTVIPFEEKISFIWMIHRHTSSTATKRYYDSYEEALVEGVGEGLKYAPQVN